MLQQQYTKRYTIDPRLYIIMRKDIQDMNPGKAMAQAAHAQADFGAFLASMVGRQTLTLESLVRTQDGHPKYLLTDLQLNATITYNKLETKMKPSIRYMLRQCEIDLAQGLMLLEEVEFRLRQNPHSRYFDIKKDAQKYAKSFAEKMIWC